MDPFWIVPERVKARSFRAEEIKRLKDLRRRYYTQPHLFTEPELAKLCFYRWLVASGRLQA